MSSRNAYLEPADRARAVALRRGLDAAEAAIGSGERDPAAVAAAARAAMARHGVEPEYLELVSTADLAPVADVDGEVLVAVAARVGAARLIDNAIVRAPARAASSQREKVGRSQCSA
jgi:pantoate--beta-alanine ligase